MEATRGKGRSAETLLLTSPNSSLSEIAHPLQNRTRESKKQVRATETVFPWDMQIGVN